ncbi:MAG TPA: hypothetical protein VE779_05435, partial [Candidatus Angelobacter sp.]|nr:hypothetical protein [Candidatus Angelobacter sp.]
MAKIDSPLQYETDSAPGCHTIGIDQQSNGSDFKNFEQPPSSSSHAGGGDRLRPAEDESSSFADPSRLPQTLREAILNHVQYTLVRPTTGLKPVDYLKPLSLAIRDRIVDRMLATESKFHHKDAKRLYYLSMEFLM